MSWRVVVISQSAKLDYQLGYMVVRQAEIKKIHISEINTVIIETTSVSITAALLSELVKNKIKVIFCDEQRNPLSELIPYHGSHDSSAKIRSQVEWGQHIKSEVWTEIVREKVYQQAIFLKSLNKKDEAEMLFSYIRDLEFGDKTNREGHAAKVYFNSLFGLNFTRGEDCPTNAALNYGYSIILSCFTREIAANGYITQLGLFHDNMFNPFNLASDLMEPFRILVDRRIYEMELEEFSIDEKREVVRLLNKTVEINGRNETVNNAIKIYCKSVFDAIENKNLSNIKFYRYEL